MPMSFLSAVVLLLLILDPFGNIPFFISALAKIDHRRHAIIILRECGIAFLVLVFFLLFGKQFMHILHISQNSVGIAGGIVLFLIALRMIFYRADEVFGDTVQGEPLIVPLAVPLIAGPSAISMVLLLVLREPHRLLDWMGALAVAILVSAVILLLANKIARVLGKQVLTAVERLTGLILTIIAVEMFLTGIKAYFN